MFLQRAEEVTKVAEVTRVANTSVFESRKNLDMNGNADKDIHILIVEDEKNIGDLLRESLAADDRSIKVSYDGAEAIRELKRKKYDLVITDIMLPGASGIDVLREAKTLYPHSMVIIITGYASLETAIEAVREGAYDYLRKPFRLDEIKISVNNACEKISLIRENSLLMHNLKQAYAELKRLDEAEKRQAKAAGANIGRAELRSNSLDIFPRHVIPPSYFEGEEGIKKILTDLERIIRLKNAGLLDEDEFSLCKKLLLEMAK